MTCLLHVRRDFRVDHPVVFLHQVDNVLRDLRHVFPLKDRLTTAAIGGSDKATLLCDLDLGD